MPPEMITIVAPIAMIAKKLASVAVWISVYEFQKLLTLSPVCRSGCEPASAVRMITTATSTSTSPISCEANSRLSACRMKNLGGLSFRAERARRARRVPTQWADEESPKPALRSAGDEGSRPTGPLYQDDGDSSTPCLRHSARNDYAGRAARYEARKRSYTT